MNASSNKPKFDALKLISQALTYVKHIKLMLLMMALGLLVGIVVFMFTTPTYQSTALVSVESFGAPVVDRDVPETFRATIFTREFLASLKSSRVQIAAAKRMGLVGEGATSEQLVNVIPQVLILPTDGRNLEFTVLAYDPEVVRNFAKEMVAAYQDLQQQAYEDYRNEGLVRFAEQVERLENEISETMKSLSSVERDQNLTEAMLEQQSLMEIPKQLIQTREQLARMKGVRSLLVKLESQAQTPGEPSADGGPGDNVGNMVSLLSLLGSFEDETSVKLGDVVPTSRPVGPSTIKNAPLTTNNIVGPSDVESIEPWRKLEKERRILLDQIRQNSGIYLPDHRVMRDLEDKLYGTERGLETEFKMMRQKFDLNYASLEEKEKMLEARIPEYHAITEQIGKSSHDYSSLAAKQAMWDKARERLAEKLEVITFAKDYDWTELRYKGLTSLRDDVPVSPNKSKIAMIALMLGLAGAFGAPTMLNLLDTTARTVPQIEQITGLTGIGIVPLSSKEMLEDVCRSPAQGATVPNHLLECFRVIRANIITHPNRFGKSQVVLVTSARPQEGKTTQASNLAWAFRSMGEKTLLIDCDLRRGRVHGVVGTINSPGMTRLLLNECTVDEAIQSAGSGGFDIIPRGPVIAGTTDLLCQKVFHDLLELFRDKYDRIVIDAPPCLGLSETSSLQQIVDGTVLVVRAEVTGRKDVMDMVSTLKRTDAHIFGFVLNAIDLSKLGNYYDYSYYSASYYDVAEAEAQPARLVKSRA